MSLRGSEYMRLSLTTCFLQSEFYRKTSREVKRIDSNQRSFIYSSFGEQLTGMASIRAYRQQDRFKTKLQKAVDVECVSRSRRLSVIIALTQGL